MLTQRTFSRFGSNARFGPFRTSVLSAANGRNEPKLFNVEFDAF